MIFFHINQLFHADCLAWVMATLIVTDPKDGSNYLLGNDVK